MLLKDNVIDLANDILLEFRFDNDVNDVLHPLYDILTYHYELRFIYTLDYGILDL